MALSAKMADVNTSENGDGPEKKKQKMNEIKEGVLLGYGNALLDMCVNADKAFLDKYDLKPNNAIIADATHKNLFDDVIETYKDSVEYVPGGATQNSLRVAQWLLRVPNATSFFGCISDDKFGKMLEDKCKKQGVNVQYQRIGTDKEPTGTCAALVTGPNRSLCANLAAANCFTEEHLDVPENWQLVEKASFYYIAGFPLTVSPSSMLRIAKHANENGKTFCTNLSAPFICQFFMEPLLKVLPYADVLFGNETEADTFSKENNFNTTDRKEIALKLAEMTKENNGKSRTVVITQGDQPIIVAKDGKITEYPIIPVKAEDLVDTNGAGDAFVGGYLAQLVLGQSIADCVRCGNYAANLIIQRSGCSLPDEPDFKCGNNFCASHRYAESHDCTFDYKTVGRKLLEQSNPVVSAPKLPKI